MADDGRKKPPPRPPFPRPVEPFKSLTEPRAESSHVETGAALQGVRDQLDEVLASHREILGNQRKLAQQMDGLGTVVNTRFNIFHEELALLRATVVGDHAPRLDDVEVDIQKVGTEVEKVSAAQRAKKVAFVGTNVTAYLALAAWVLRAIGKAYPGFGAVVDPILDQVGP